METEANQTESPRVKFHWCRSVRCLSKKVFLILTSESATKICLQWKTGSGWFESDFISLSSGFYTGYISIREKKKCGFFENSEKVIERQYKIDPFFVTLQRYSIELFIESGNVPKIWQEVQVCIKRQAISQPLVSLDTTNEESKPKTKWSSSCELGRNYKEETEKIELDYRLSSPDISFNSFAHSKSDDTLADSRIDHGLTHTDESNLSVHNDSKSLQRWNSIGNKGTLDLTLLDCSDLSLQIEQDRELENIEQQFTISASQVSSQITNQNGNCQPDVRDSHIFKEIDPVKGSIERGYGCLITIESRSTSLDDLGSTRNLENVLVSLSSNDADNKLSSNFDLFVPTGVVPDLVEGEIVEDFESEHNFRLSINGSIESNDTDSKYPESDLTINEEENFVYDSLKNEDFPIPLNIKNLSCTEDSLEYQNPPAKPKRYSHYIVDQSVSTRLEATSKEATVSDSFVLVNPGSLGSDTDSIKVTNTNVDVNDQTPSEIDLFEAVATVRKLSYEIQPIIQPQVVSENIRTPKITNDRPIMSSTGTQTYSRDLPNSIHKKTLPTYNRRLKKEQVDLSDDSYSPLPYKVQGPWQSCRFQKPIQERRHMSAKSILKNFKRNFQNLNTAEQIARSIPREVNPHESHSSFRNPSIICNSRNSSSDIYSHSNYVNSSDYSSPSMSRSNRSRSQTYYEVPSMVKEMPSPLINIYGQHLRKEPSSRAKHPTKHNHVRGTMKPTFSLPNLRDCYQVDSPTLTVSQKYKIRSIENENQETNRRHRRKDRSSEHSKRRRHRSYDQSKYLKENSSSSGSTESLIEEANNLRRNVTVLSNSNIAKYWSQNNDGDEEDLRYCIRRKPDRIRSRSYNKESSTEGRRASMFVPQESVKEVDRSLRTRSETDLRMIGTFSGGHYGSRPYLPYEQEQLSVGQVVKVLVPGSGVAMARVIYTPQNKSHLLGKNVSVLLISEPSVLCGSVINIPMNKILLAWPKHNKENITFI